MRKLLIASMLLSGSMLPFACKKVDQNVKLHMNTNVTNATVVINVTDMATGEPITSALRIKVNGKNADDVYTFSGDKTFKSEKGKIILTVKSPKAGEEAISFSVSVGSNSFLPASVNLTIAPGQPHHEASVSMMSVSAPPEGTRIKSFTMSVGTSGLTKTSTASAKTTDTAYFDKELTTVFFPAGTQFYYYKDENGQVVPVLDRTIAAVNGTSINESYQLFEERADKAQQLTRTNYTGTIRAYLITSQWNFGSSRATIETRYSAASEADPGATITDNNLVATLKRQYQAERSDTYFGR